MALSRPFVGRFLRFRMFPFLPMAIGVFFKMTANRLCAMICCYALAVLLQFKYFLILNL